MEPMPQPQKSDIQGQLWHPIFIAETAINSICQQGEAPNKWGKKLKRPKHWRWGMKLNKTNQHNPTLPRYLQQLRKGKILLLRGE